MRTAVCLVVDHGHGQVHFLAHRLRAGGNRIQPRRQRSQRGQQGLGPPARRVAAQQVDRLVVGQHGGELHRLFRLQQPGQCIVATGGRQRGDEAAMQPGDLALAIQPLPQRQRAALVGHLLRAVQLQNLQPLPDQHRRVARPYAQRIAGLVMQAGAFQRQLDMAHVARAVAPRDALVGQHAGGERPLAGIRIAAWHGVQRGHPRRRADLLQQFAGPIQHPLRPRRGHRLDLHVRLAECAEAGGAQLGQPRIEPAPDRAELRVAGIAQAQHGELQRRQLRRTLAGDELEQAACIVRRLAIALGADHQQQVTLLRQLALRVGIGTQQPHRQAGRLAATGQLPGDALRVAGLAAVDDAQPLGHLARRRDGRQAASLRLLGLRRTPRGDPVQLGRAQPVQLPGQPGKLLRGGSGCGKIRRGDRIHVISIWTSIRLDA